MNDEVLRNRIKQLHYSQEFMDALVEYAEGYATRDGETELDVLAALEKALGL